MQRGGRPRQAPVRALRGRPHAPLPPAHDRQVGRLRPRRALAPRPAPRVAGDPHRRARGRAVRRPGAGADDRLAHALRPAPRAGSGRTSDRRRVRRARASCAACARTTRRAASATPCSTSATWPASGTSGRPSRASSPGVDPWRAVGERDATRRRCAIVRAARPLMRESAERGGRIVTAPGGAGTPGSTRTRAGPCRRCGEPIRSRGQGDDNRTTYWCPGCQALIRVGHKGADHVAPGNTVESFEAALEHGVDMIEFDVLRTHDGRLVLAHDYDDAERPRVPDARGGARPLRRRGLSRDRARRGPQAARLRARGDRRAARARPRWSARCSRPRGRRASRSGRSGARHAARLVGPARAPRLDEDAAGSGRLRGGAVVARRDAGRRAARMLRSGSARRSWPTGCS